MNGPPPQRAWRTEAVVLVLAAAAVTLLFAALPLDVAAARWFYRPDSADRWPVGARAPWPLLYRAAPWVTASLVVASLAALAAGAVSGRRSLRRGAVLVLLAVVLGPGLLGNLVLKDHWSHPRPREIVEFGGTMRYVAPPLPGREGGASFPCGHCTVGFLYGIGWWIGRRRGVRAASLAAGLLAGGLLGVGRIVAGAHFLSDVLWSALLAAGVVHVLHYHVLRGPRDEAPGAAPAASRRALRRTTLATVVAVLGGAGILVALFAVPRGAPIDAVVRFDSLPRAPRVLEVEARKATVEIALVDVPEAEMRVRGELHGFGLPFDRLGTAVEFAADPVPTVRFRVEQRGVFTDLDGFASLRVPAAALERVVVRLGRGDIRVADETRGRVVERGVLRLDLATGAGRVRAPVPGQ